MFDPIFPSRRTRWNKAAAAIGATALLLGTSAVLAATASASSSPNAVAATLYVSPGGSGTACSNTAPCSLTGAQAKVRTLAPSMSGDIDVDLVGGTYRLASTFKLGPQDSGLNGHEVITRPHRDRSLCSPARGRSPAGASTTRPSGSTARRCPPARTATSSS